MTVYDDICMIYTCIPGDNHESRSSTSKSQHRYIIIKFYAMFDALRHFTKNTRDNSPLLNSNNCEKYTERFAERAKSESPRRVSKNSAANPRNLK